VLDVTGMTCASCVRRVERALGKVPGVDSATVNFAAETARISLSEPVEPDKLIAAVEKARPATHPQLYGDGRAAAHIIEAINSWI